MLPCYQSFEDGSEMGNSMMRASLRIYTSQKAQDSAKKFKLLEYLFHRHFYQMAIDNYHSDPREFFVGITDPADEFIANKQEYNAEAAYRNYSKFYNDNTLDVEESKNVNARIISMVHEQSAFNKCTTQLLQQMLFMVQFGFITSS